MRFRTVEATALALALALTVIISAPTTTGYEPTAMREAEHFSAVVLPPTPEPSQPPKYDPWRDYPVPVAPVTTPPPVPKPRVKVAVTPKPTAKPKPRLGSGRIRGVATWYCKPGRSRCTRGFASTGAYGAAGPELRAALGKWRGKTVYVNGVAVRLIDWCACGGNHVIDVYYSTWVKIPNQSHVTIRW